MDPISGFFQCAIHEDSIPITAVYTTFGNYEWTRCPIGLASSPGWFRSITLRVCEGLERCIHRQHFDLLEDRIGARRRHEAILQAHDKVQPEVGAEDNTPGGKGSQILGR